MVQRNLTLTGRAMVPGVASGKLLVSSTPLSFMSGVDPETGTIVDHHHPLCGESVQGRFLAIPCGRGSCSGSAIILELLLNDHGPLGFIFQKQEQILTLGVLVAKLLFSKSIPVVVLNDEAFSLLHNGDEVHIFEDKMEIGSEQVVFSAPVDSSLSTGDITLTDHETKMLSGELGPAPRIAMEAILHFAKIQGATSLIPVSRVHVDACYYCGPAMLLFTQRLQSLSAKFSVPTTLNALSVDQRRWRELGTDAQFGEAASEVADTYMKMGAQVSFTCAPYLLQSKPKEGEQIGWAESNAVVFANSVLGARTQKYPDFLEVFIGIAGRAPLAGCHLEEGRLPTIWIVAPNIKEADDALWPLLAHRIGEIAGLDIPFISGLEDLKPTVSDMKAFGAAFATTSSAPMFHINGITPEASKMEHIAKQLAPIEITLQELRDSYRTLNSALDTSLGLLSLGNPHFSLEEFTKLSALCKTRHKHDGVRVVITTGRETYEKASETGIINSIIDFGGEIITDTCWCFIGEPIIPIGTKNLMTNSGKYAHYAPGIINRGVHFASLAECVKAACDGRWEYTTPAWLSGTDS